MKIAILVAMDKELRLLLSLMPERTEERIAGSIYYRGKLNGHEILAGKCGIGKVNSAINTMQLIIEERPDMVINSGVAGGAGGGIEIGDVLIAEHVAYHDVWCGPGTVYGTADGSPLFFHPSVPHLEIARQIAAGKPEIKFGLICSGDKFIDSAEQVAEIRSHFPEVLAVDMESASIAQVCYMTNVPFMIVRVMSDTPGQGDNVAQYKDFWNVAPQKTFECVADYISRL